MIVTGNGIHTNKVHALAIAHKNVDLSKVQGMSQKCIETRVCLMGVFWHATVTCYYDRTNTVLH